MKYLIMFLSFAAHAQCGLVVPLYTDHINHSDGYEYSENNSGMGLECGYNKYTFGYIRAVNSFSYNANFVYISHPLYAGFDIGVLAGDNYPDPNKVTLNYRDTNNDGFMKASPVFSYKYKMLRFVTSYPFAKLVGSEPHMRNDDVISVQLIVGIN